MCSIAFATLKSRIAGTQKRSQDVTTSSSREKRSLDGGIQISWKFQLKIYLIIFSEEMRDWLLMSIDPKITVPVRVLSCT